MKWVLAYGAHGPLALQEYYVRYKSGDNSYTPGDTKLDRMISAITTTPDVDKHLSESPRIGYIGFDPTSDSMHIGNLVQIMILIHLQKDTP